MSNYKRNDSCPCGSGKKYKKCCGTLDITDFQPEVINRELDRVHQQFISFAMDKHKDIINKQIIQYSTSSDWDDDDMNEIYQTGLIIWILLNVTCLPEEKTIFDAFYNTYHTQIKHQAKHTLRQWPSAAPSVYEVLPANDQTSLIPIKELLTDNVYHIPVAEGEQFIEGSLLIGTLAPYFEGYNFFYSMIKLYSNNKKSIMELLTYYTTKDNGLRKHFPAFLTDALLLKTDSGNDPQREQVVQLFANHMVDKEVTDKVILTGIDLWNDYYKQEKPSFVKSESYAAALEYFVQKIVLNNSAITQGQVAKEYGASHGTVAAHYRKLFQRLAGDM